MSQFDEIKESLSELSSDVKIINDNLIAQTVHVESLKEESAKIRKILIEGNGRSSLMERMALVEDSISNASKSASLSRRGHIQLRVATVSAVLAMIGAIGSSLVQLLR